DVRLVVVSTVNGLSWEEVEAIAYDPATDRWSQIERRKNTEGRYFTTADGGGGTVWNGRQLVLLGGYRASALGPATATWRSLPHPPFTIYETAAVATTDGALYLWGPDGGARWMAASACRSAPVESAKARKAPAVGSVTVAGSSASSASAIADARSAGMPAAMPAPTPPRMIDRTRGSRVTNRDVIIEPIE